MDLKDYKFKIKENLNKYNDKKFTLLNVRLLYGALFEPHRSDDKYKLKYKISVLIKKNNPTFKYIENIFSELTIYGAPTNERLYCLDDGDLSENNQYHGHYIFRASNENQPIMYMPDKTIVSYDDSTFYSGCYVNVVASMYKFGHPVSISATLLGVQFSSHGEAFGAKIYEPSIRSKLPVLADEHIKQIVENDYFLDNLANENIADKDE